MASTGPGDPTRASIPFHIAANGAAAAGIEAEIALAGDAVELVKDEVARSVRGVGIPPFAELLQGCLDKGIRIHV